MWSRIGRGRVRALGVALLMPHALLALAVRVLAASDSAEPISAALLHELDLSDFAQGLADKGFRTRQDLHERLGVEDMRQLGVKMGPRNRVTKWQNSATSTEDLPAAMTLTSAPKNVSQAATREFIKALLSPTSNSLKGALRLWEAHADQLDLRPMLTRGAKAECSALMGGAKKSSKACMRAFRNLMASLTTPDSATREVAWELFEAMLPRLHDGGAQLDAQYATTRQGQALTAKSTGVRVTPLLVAALLNRPAAVSMLAHRGHCSALRSKRSRSGERAWAADRAWSPLTQICWMWAYRFHEQLPRFMFNADTQGVLKPLRTFVDNYRELNAHAGPGRTGQLEAFGLDMLLLPTWQRLAASLELGSEGDKVHTLYYEDYLRVTDSILGAVLRALAPCVDKPLASYAEPADGMTALHVLGKRGFVLATQTLLDMGAEPDAQYRPEGHTPLHLALIENHHATVALLTKASSSNGSIRDSSGLTEMHLAKLKQSVPTKRAAGELEFRRSVEKAYVDSNSRVDSDGGWGTETEFKWPRRATAEGSSESNNGNSQDQVACGFDEVELASVTPQQLETQFLRIKRPVIIRAGCAGFHARESFSKEALLKRLGHLQIEHGDIPYRAQYTGGKRRLASIKELVSHFQATMREANAVVANETGAKAPTCVFNSNYRNSEDKIRKVIISSIDKVLAAAKLPPRAPFLTAARDQQKGAQFYIGGPGTGSPLHFHGFAWNALVYGRKYWLMTAPGQAVTSTKGPIEFLVQDLAALKNRTHPPLECVQRAGDITIVPAGWSHLVLNLLPSVGVAQEFSSTSFADFS